MSQLDREKEKLADYRRWQNYCVTVLIALIAFVATQYDKVGSTLLCLSAATMLVMVIGIVFLSRKINKSYDEIEKL